MMLKEFRIAIDREEDGRWIASVLGVRGAHVYGSTKAKAVERAKELALWYLIESDRPGRIPEHISFVFARAAAT